MQLLYEKLQKKLKELKDWDSEYLHNKWLLNEQEFSNDKDLKDRVIKHIDETQSFKTWKLYDMKQQSMATYENQRDFSKIFWIEAFQIFWTVR